VTQGADVSLPSAGALARGADATPRPGRQGGGLRSFRPRARHLGVVPFFVYVAIFLLWPTVVVIVGAFQNSSTGKLTFSNITAVLTGSTFLQAFWGSIRLSAETAIAGGVLGALLAWAVAEGDRDGIFRRQVVAMSGVLAQFGGVMLAFAFLATFGYAGVVTLTLHRVAGVNPITAGSWIYSFTGLAVVYTFFQIPLMVLIFLPAVDGLKVEWREASDNLGGGAWAYWRYVAGPILAPAFIGGLLLLFVSAFSAYATAAALISQGSPIVPLQIRTFLTSEVVLGQANMGKALAFGMVVVVAVVMTLYAWLQRRGAKWQAK